MDSSKKLSEDNKDALDDELVALRDYFGDLEDGDRDAVLRHMLDFAKQGLNIND